jgi:DNA-binding phage protein
MTLTYDPKETLRERAKREPAFRKVLLAEAVGAMLEGDSQTAKSLLRDYVVAAVGFGELEAATGIPAKSILRMLSAKGNPRMDNLAEIIAALQAKEGVRLQVGLKRAS